MVRLRTHTLRAARAVFCLGAQVFPAPGDTAAQKGPSVHPPSPSSALLGHFENSLRLFEALLFKFSEKVLYRNQGKLTRG